MIPAHALDNARAHEALRQSKAEALELMASEEALEHPDAAVEMLGLESLADATPAEIREAVGRTAAVQVKMHRGGVPA